MFILASESPRRIELLKLLLPEFQVIPAKIEESYPNDIIAKLVPEYLARKKADFVAGSYPNDVVIGADTVVLIDGKILGKPKDANEAADMLRLLSGRTHEVITGCAVCSQGGCETICISTKVTFYKLSPHEIKQYISTGESLDKAGAYGIQGGGALFVKHINGDYYNVVGLPVAPLKRLLNL